MAQALGSMLSCTSEQVFLLDLDADASVYCPASSRCSLA